MFRRAGIRNYSIWQAGDTLFGYYECDDLQTALAVQKDAPVSARWRTYMRDVIRMERDPKSGALEEAWCVGTAAVISPIGELAWNEETFEVNQNRIGALSQRLYDELTGIQWGTKPDPFGWVCPID